MSIDTESGIVRNELLGQFGIVPAFVLHSRVLGSTCFSVYAALCIYANKDGLAWPSQTTLAADLKLEEKTVRRAIVLLETEGFISVERPERSGRGRFCKYTIVDKRGSYATPSADKGGQKGVIGHPRKGTPGPVEQYHRTIEQGLEKKGQQLPPSAKMPGYCTTCVHWHSDEEPHG